MKTTLPPPKQNPSRLPALWRHALLGAALSLGLAAQADYSSTVQADSPLGYWRLGETPTLTTDTLVNLGSLSTSADGVGYSLTHSVPGALAGSTATAIGFTGAVAIMGNPAAFNFTGTASFTLEAWVKPAALGGSARVIANGISGQGYAFGFQGLNTLRLTGLGVADVTSDAAPVNFTLGQWIHIAVVRDGTAVRFYTNGVQFGAAKSLANVITTARPLVLGRNSSFGEPFSGDIDEAAVYNTALPGTAIAAHYAAGATVGGDYPAAVLADVPIGYWRLNEAQPAPAGTVASSGSVAASGTPIGAAGSVTGGATGALVGDPNTAMTFNGNDGKIDVAYQAALNANSSWSIECWVRMDSWANNYQSPLANRNDSGTGQRGYLLYAAPVGGQPQWQFWHGTGTGWGTLTGPNATVGQWAHLVGTYDATLRTKTFYVDGQRVGVAAAQLYAPNEAMPLRLGAGVSENPFGNYFWSGVMDEVAVFPGALSSDRVAAHYAAAQGTPPPLIAAPVAVVNPPGAQTVHSDVRVQLDAGFTGSIPLTFKWYRVSPDFTATNLVAGQTSESLVIASATVADSGYYVCEAANGVDSAQSNPAYLEVLPPQGPVPTEPLPATMTVYPGATITLQAIYGGTPPLAYQWLTNGVPIPNATNVSVTLSNLQPAGSVVNCTLQITNRYGSATPNVQLNITTPPANTYAAALVGLNPLSWWRLGETAGSIAYDSWGGRNGRYENSYPHSTPGALLDDDDGGMNVYGAGSRMVVSNSVPFNFTGTNAFTLVTWARPDVLSGVQRLVSNRSSTPNGGYGFGFLNLNQVRLTAFGVVDVNASVASFNLGEWYHVAAVRYTNRMDLYINGELRNSATLSTVNTTLNTATGLVAPLQLGGNPTGTEFFTGGIDETAVFNRALSAADIAALYAARFGSLVPPTITLQPLDNRLYAGGTAHFIVAAAGSAPLTYAWKSNNVAIAGATNATLTIPNVALGMSGSSYTVTVANSAGSVTSQSASLTVLPGYGYEAAVAADGPAAFWRLNEAFGPTLYDSLGGYNGYETNGVVFGQPGALANDADTAIQLDGTAAYVQVPHSPALNPEVFSVECWARPTGGASVYRAAVSSRDYQAGYIIYAGANNNWQFWTRMPGSSWENLGGSPVVLDEWVHLVATFDGTNKTLYANGAVVASQVNTNYSPNLLRPLRIGAGNNEDDPGAGSVYPFVGQLDEVAIYPRVLTPAQVAAHYNLGKYSTNTAPFIVRQPSAQTVAVGTPVALSVQAGGSPVLTYQWRKNGTPIPGATQATLTVASATFEDNGDYQLAIQNPVGSTNSATVALTVMPLPTFANVTNGLVLHLEFENSVADTSGRANHGTTIGSPTYVTGAVGAKALRYSTDVNAGSFNCVTLGAPLDLSFGTEVNFSVAYWVRFTGSPGDLPFLCTALQSYGGVGLTFAPGYGTGTWSYYVRGTTDPGVGTGYATAAINDGNWHSLVHTFDRTGNGLTYLDGVLVDTRSIASVADLDNFQTMNIGQDPTGTYAENGAAEIDDVGIWRRVLSTYEAQSIAYVGRTYGLSFNSTGPVTLQVQATGNTVEVIWQTGTLEENTDLSNPAGWTPVPGAVAPFYQAPASAARKFYRVRL